MIECKKNCFFCHRDVYRSRYTKPTNDHLAEVPPFIVEPSIWIWKHLRIKFSFLEFDLANVVFELLGWFDTRDQFEWSAAFMSHLHLLTCKHLLIFWLFRLIPAASYGDLYWTNISLLIQSIVNIVRFQINLTNYLQKWERMKATNTCLDTERLLEVRHELKLLLLQIPDFRTRARFNPTAVHIMMHKQTQRLIQYITLNA